MTEPRDDFWIPPPPNPDQWEQRTGPPSGGYPGSAAPSMTPGQIKAAEQMQRYREGLPARDPEERAVFREWAELDADVVEDVAEQQHQDHYAELEAAGTEAWIYAGDSPEHQETAALDRIAKSRELGRDDLDRSL